MDSDAAFRRFAFLVVALAALTAATQTLADNGGGPSWNMIGNDSANSRNNPFETQISTANVSRLAPKWSLPSPVPGEPPNQFATTTGDVSATPAVVDGAVYFGDFGGTVWKLDADTGQVDLVASGLRLHRDQRTISRARARRSRATRSSSAASQRPVHARNRRDDRRAALEDAGAPGPQASGHGIMTGSPVLAGDTVFTGVSASGRGRRQCHLPRRHRRPQRADRQAPLADLSRCPTTAVEPGGYAGATMFSPPAVDESGRPRLSARSGSRTRNRRASTRATRPMPTGSTESCEQPGSFFKSIVAFDLKTGEPRWSYRVQGHDALAAGVRLPAGDGDVVRRRGRQPRARRR